MMLIFTSIFFLDSVFYYLKDFQKYNLRQTAHLPLGLQLSTSAPSVLHSAFCSPNIFTLDIIQCMQHLKDRKKKKLRGEHRVMKDSRSFLLHVHSHNISQFYAKHEFGQVCKFLCTRCAALFFLSTMK